MAQRGPNSYICARCGERKGSTSFYPGYGDQSGDRILICNTCCADKLQKYRDRLGDEAGFWCLLAEVGVPYIKEVYADTVYRYECTPKGKRGDFLGYYLKKLRQHETIYSGFWDSNIMLDELLESSRKQTRDATMSIEEMEKIWGKYENYNEAYPFLEDTFNAYTEDILEMDANLTNRYRDLAKAEYRMRLAEEAGDIGDIAKAQQNVAKLLSLLKLDNFQENKQSETEKFVERMAWTIENTKPAECEDLEKYKDFSGFGKVWDDIMRCVQNLICHTREYPDVPKAEK